MNKKISERFESLMNEVNAIETAKVKVASDYGDGWRIDHDALLSWRVKAKNIIIQVCGEASQHFVEFVHSEKLNGLGDGYYKALKRTRAVLGAAKDDFEGGYLTSIKALVQAEVFDNELEQAEELLTSGYHVAAAVIAGVVLETGLRELCDRSTLEHGKLDKMNADLAKAGTYNKLQQKRITALADIRNNAAHGKSSEFSADDVRSMIKEVEQFLAQHLG
ncbi:DUF4145 domain-containing protein [Pseudomonas zeae]|uniref:DUF4145 domain-containing protein n=1 Tax=Pseudomonas zeae TaxID=2745510 RepID=A0A9E6NMN4_9PSED|nr:DUF4145 domain-containing protein [Pseudomonas zeae]QXI10915.1 DUF4145 domain-containing protein [Pseudomonas zeae]